MTRFFKPLLLAALLAGAGISANAMMGDQHAGPMGQHHRMDPAKMHAMMVKRQAALKSSLKLGAAQEGAWNAYVASMQPPAGMGPGNRQKMHDEMAKLTTPERIDRMTAMKAQRDAEMTKRHEATKTFYATLTPEQQKVFDTQAMGGGHGPREGRPGKPGQSKS